MIGDEKIKEVEGIRSSWGKNKMKKFEYLIQDILAGGNFEEILNEYGQEGWELSALYNLEGLFAKSVFKREILE